MAGALAAAGLCGGEGFCLLEELWEDLCLKTLVLPLERLELLVDLFLLARHADHLFY